jgi:transposase
VRNFQTILLPTFETGKMVEHVESRKISNATARTMMCLSHYKFRCKLQDLCARHGRELYIVGEDRDIQGARNILLKNWQLCH